MANEEKKTISFGFSKLQKVSIIGSKLPPKSEDVVQFIDCLENKSIKVKNEEPKKGVLVIPLNKPDSHSIVQSRIVGRQVKSIETPTNDASVSETSRNDLSSRTQLSTSKDAPTTVESATENLDQLAAKEILEDLKKLQEKKEESSTFSVPLSSAPVTEKESTLDDYDNIPIAEFGKAMLRGMGWKPGKGIGKNEQLVTAKPPVLRPKGLGLGADKVIQPEKTSETKEETLKLVKGSYIRIIAGAHKDLFGEIMGFDEETGRLIAKMAISGSVLTFNEFMVKAVNKDEYNKNSKVLNVKKYEEFKEKENAGEDPNDIIESMKNQVSKSDKNVSSSRHYSDTRRRGKDDMTDDSLHNRRDRYKESRNRSDRQRSNSQSEEDTTTRRSHLKGKRYEKKRYSSESDAGSDPRRQYSKSDRTMNKRNWKTKEIRSSSEDSERGNQKHRRGKRSSSISDEDNERSRKKKHRSSHHSSDGKRKKKSREASSPSEEEEDNSHRRRKNDKEVVKKVSKSLKDYKFHRVASSYSKDKTKSKKSSRKYSSSSDSSSSEEENIRSSKKSKIQHKKKHRRSRSRS